MLKYNIRKIIVSGDVYQPEILLFMHQEAFDTYVLASLVSRGLQIEWNF
jgi:hypothetical protein